MILEWNNTTKKLTLDGTEYSLANHYTLESLLRVFSSGGVLEEANGISLSLRRGSSIAEIDIDSNNQITFSGETYNSSQAITKEKLIRVLSSGGAIPLTGNKYLINYVLDSGQTPDNPDIGVVEITNNFLTNAETNLRVGGAGNNEWTTLQKAYVLDPAKDTIVKFSTKKYWITNQQYYIMCLNNFGTSDSLTDIRTWWNLVVVDAKTDGTLEVHTEGLKINKDDVGFDNYQDMLQNKATVISNVINYLFGTLTFLNEIRVYEEGGQDPVTDFTVQNVFYVGPQSVGAGTGGVEVEQAWKYNWDNLRQHGEANDQWTVIEENTCRIIKNNGDEDWEAFKITDFLKPGNYFLLTPWKWSNPSPPSGGKWINGTSFSIAADGTITFVTDVLEWETKLQISGVKDNDLASFWTAIEANPKYWFDHKGKNNNNHFYLYPDDSKQVNTRLSTIPFEQYKVSIDGTERIWNA